MIQNDKWSTFLITTKIMIHVTARKNTENILSKRNHTESHLDHTHLVHFKSMKVFNMWERPSDGSRKEKLH